MWRTRIDDLLVFNRVALQLVDLLFQITYGLWTIRIKLMMIRLRKKLSKHSRRKHSCQREFESLEKHRTHLEHLLL